MKQGYVMYKSWNPVFRSLPEEAAGKLLHAIAAYQDGEDVTLEDPMLNAVFKMIQQTFEADNEKYAETCERRREAGKKGGRPRKEPEPEEQRITNGFKSFFDI